MREASRCWMHMPAFVPNDTWNVTLGQMRVPFTIDAHRSPHQQYFANRSFIAKQVGNVRDVGATGAFSLKEGLPLKLEGGLFNAPDSPIRKSGTTR